MKSVDANALSLRVHDDCRARAREGVGTDRIILDLSIDGRSSIKDQSHSNEVGGTDAAR